MTEVGVPGDGTVAGELGRPLPALRAERLDGMELRAVARELVPPPPPPPLPPPPPMLPPLPPPLAALRRLETADGVRPPDLQLLPPRPDFDGDNGAVAGDTDRPECGERALGVTDSMASLL